MTTSHSLFQKALSMVRFGYVWAAIVIGGAMISRPAAAQQGGASRSLTHVVSVTIPPRVKVEMSRIAAPSAPAAGQLTPGEAATGGLALTVRATQGWALSVKSAAGVENTVARADSGSAASAATVFFRGAPGSSKRSQYPDSPVILTVSAP